MKDINVVLADYPGVGRVRLCDCNAIHFTVGPVTVNLTPQTFAQVEALIRAARDQLTVIAGSDNSRCTSLGSFEPHPGQLTH